MNRTFVYGSDRQIGKFYCLQDWLDQGPNPD